ncbi:MAG: phosphopantothenoylcysteine decarboxylase, partial [Phenylobacterium sp.]
VHGRNHQDWRVGGQQEGGRQVVGEARPRLVVGFAAETEAVEDHARAKLARKGCDWIVANDVSRPGVMGGSDNTVSIVTRDGVERWDEAPKAEVARRLAARIAATLGSEPQ